MPSHLHRWQQQVIEMQTCATVDELVARHGEPHHKEHGGALEIWHYPLGEENGMQYSIHVSVTPGARVQCYMFMAPVR